MLMVEFLDNICGVEFEFSENILDLLSNGEYIPEYGNTAGRKSKKSEAYNSFVFGKSNLYLSKS